MTLIRSLVYQLFLYIAMALVGILFLPVFIFGARAQAAGAPRLWAFIALWGLRAICGIRHEVRGLEHVLGRPLLVACKHQSMWETLYLLTLFKTPAIVLKKELLATPIFGAYAKKVQMISVDRDDGAAAIKDLARQAQKALADGREIVIFPEGTRMPPGAAPDYKPGVALLYRQLGIACVPAALNSGLCWQGNGILKRPGTITIEFLPAIAPGLDRRSFMAELEQRIETASERLRREADNAHPQKRLNAVNA
jgi:1-acyl-sn-glycerol-3-phosphate acyltransferase